MKYIHLTYYVSPKLTRRTKCGICGGTVKYEIVPDRKCLRKKVWHKLTCKHGLKDKDRRLEHKASRVVYKRPKEQELEIIPVALQWLPPNKFAEKVSQLLGR